MPSARGRAASAPRPADASRASHSRIGDAEEEDAEDGGEAQLPADVAGHARVDRQGHHRGQAQRVQAGRSAALPGSPGGPLRPSRPLAGSRGRSRPAGRRRRSGRSSRAGARAGGCRRRRGSASPAGRAGSRSRRSPRVRWLRPARMKSSFVALVQPVVVAEDEAAGERRLARRHALPQPGLGAFADLAGRARPRAPPGRRSRSAPAARCAAITRRLRAAGVRGALPSSPGRSRRSGRAGRPRRGRRVLRGT